jgi:hypothetical protein
MQPYYLCRLCINHIQLKIYYVLCLDTQVACYHIENRLKVLVLTLVDTLVFLGLLRGAE